MRSMSEIGQRLGAAWAVLRGKPVMRGVEFRCGELRMRHRDDLYVSDSTIEECEVLTRGPVVARVSKGATWQDNTGTALDYPGGVSYD
jgi:hypothetical protein